MTRQKNIYIAKALTVLTIPVVLYAYATGPDPGKTGGIQGESLCTECHAGTADSGPGRILLTFEGATYAPGVKQKITVRVEDPNQRRWGFQLTARLQSNSKTQAGSFAASDNTTQVLCSDANLAERQCGTGLLQFIEHRIFTGTPRVDGTFATQTGGATWQFEWTPPATDVGPIDFFAAGNAANNDNGNTGDRIYTAKRTLTPAVSAPRPAISANGVVNAANFEPGTAPNTWVAISGTNLATTTREWSGSDFQGNNLPTALDGTSVKINGRDAFVRYISPTQLNVLAPANDPATGPVQVTVSTGGGTSEAATVTMAAVAPAFLLFNTRYIAATHVDGGFLGPNGLFPSAPALTTPARPGEVVVLYATGFGQTNPPIPNGQIFPALGQPGAPLVTRPAFTIGGTTIPDADVQFAGQSATGLYQFNVKVPDSIGNGDQRVVATIGGVSTTDAFIFVQR